ncbi:MULTISPECIES: DUF6308 family protein [unclassified Arthrobacter]|uniref:DUF6308 family protein n=1 Tax=unclassified Arthrobacter TaxID=235627 RepID=UPI001CFFEBBF|nr:MULTISPECIES: DUF6308 family protein [unclassified Arthrobacter]WGZ80124.1 DUF6308 family protein [Arthrobacter sp. EM1]
MARKLSELRTTAAEVVKAYTAPAAHFAFATYDVQTDIRSPLAPSDVLMANLLSLKLGWQEVVPLFSEGDGAAQELRQKLDVALSELAETKPFEDFDSIEELERSVASLAVANAATTDVPQWTPTTVSKVLHRRRPQIVPLNDSYVRRFYVVKNTESRLLREALWKDLRENRGWMSELASTVRTTDGRRLTLLRLADILIWMDTRGASLS